MNNDPYRLGKLCELLTPEFSFKVGLDFDLVQKSVCEGGEGKALPKVLDFAVPFEDLRKMRAGNGTNGNVTKGLEKFTAAVGREP